MAVNVKWCESTLYTIKEDRLYKAEHSVQLSLTQETNLDYAKPSIRQLHRFYSILLVVSFFWLIMIHIVAWDNIRSLQALIYVYAIYPIEVNAPKLEYT